MRRTKNLPAAIEYFGLPGISEESKQAVMRLVQYGDEVTLARILSHDRDHCFLLTVNVGDIVAVKSGFASGYLGEGPRAFSYVIQLLEAHGADIEEFEVSADVIERLDMSALTERDLEALKTARPVRPRRWHDYVIDELWEPGNYARLWEDFNPILPLAIIDSRITDLAIGFFRSPDQCLLKGYRRLEDIVRKRTGADQHSAKLFSHAFLGDPPLLVWEGLDTAEHKARGSLFTSVYMAYRNPRAHRELGNDGHTLLMEFLLLNHLFALEKAATEARVAA